MSVCAVVMSRPFEGIAIWPAIVRFVARLLFALTGDSRAAEAGGISTAELIARFQRGQPRAFEALYDRYKDYVYRVAFFVSRNREEAEDAVQETFLDVLKALPNYDVNGPARFETWLYRVTLNRARMKMRRKSLPSEEWDDVEEQLERLPSPSSERPEAVFLDGERASTLWRAVDQLPEEHRVVVMLRYQQDLAYNEIADVLGVREGTVKSRLFNAHRKLQQLLRSET
ncbi:MAG TPA: sigma-70 family RNA polymerase sigma factor [Anaerolineae bacterium]|nr:sigma-70 family RNA polymerase sigma factor [Anaerolineae bacterium]HQI85086.1 sigma-70 family RNA polymerase sigma factor [Anaerolineae bacterium]